MILATEARSVTVSRGAVVLELGSSAARCCLLGVRGRDGKRRGVEPPSSAAFAHTLLRFERDDGRGLARRDRRRECLTAPKESRWCWFAAALPLSWGKPDLYNDLAFSRERRALL